MSVAVLGHHVWCRVVGHGMSILIVAGWGGPTDRYFALQDALNNLGYRTVLPDLPGLPGQTEPVSMTLDRWVEWVDGVAGVAMDVPFVIVSHSLSAAIALQYISKKHTGCIGAVFIAPWLFSTPLQAAIWRCIARLCRPIAPIFYREMRWVKDRQAWQNAARLFCAIGTQPIVPALVLWGNKDLPQHLFTGWKRLHRQPERHKWGHSPQITNTAELAGVIDRFVRTLR